MYLLLQLKTVTLAQEERFQSQAWCCTPVISALRRWGMEGQEFKASFNYIVITRSTWATQNSIFFKDRRKE